MGHRDFFHNASEEEGRLASGAGTILRAARNETDERSGVSPPVLRSCTGKLTHAARAPVKAIEQLGASPDRGFCYIPVVNGNCVFN